MTSEANERPTEPTLSPDDAQLPSADTDSSDAAATARRKILIGSQRDPAAYRPKPKRDWVPIEDSGKKEKGGERREDEKRSAMGSEPPASVPSFEPVVVAAAMPEISLPEQAAKISPVASPLGDHPAQEAAVKPRAAEAVQTAKASRPPAPPVVESMAAAQVGSAEVEAALSQSLGDIPANVPAGTKRFPPPNLRDRLSPDLEAEFEQAMVDVTMDTLVAGTDAVSTALALEPQTRRVARVVAVSRDDVFVELGGREQGLVSLRLFNEPPQPGTELEVVVVRFNAEDGLYEVTLPLAAAEIGDWSQVAEGILVDAHVTGHNAGGLECEVSRLRGFIPISQIALYRVENIEEFVGQKFLCLVTEADPMRRNLVLSRRAVLEREREESRKILLETLAPGQIVEGTVRKLMDFGAFVEIGNGVDGLIHVSQLGWGRIKHPSEVVQEGQKVRVRIDKIDKTTRKIGLSYRDLLESPWTSIDQKYAVQSVVRGKVVKLMDFGAFVELEPGIEGLVHISELSPKRVARVSDVVKEGDEIDVAVLSVDPNAQRISLSIKAALPEPEPQPQAPSQPQPAAGQEPPPKPKAVTRVTKPLSGGLGRATGGDKFGLKW